MCLNHFCVYPGNTRHKSLLWVVRWPQHSFLPPISSDKKKEKREPEAARGVELLCNYNVVLKSKYQALATSAGRQRKKGGEIEERRGRKKNRQGELRNATESDPAMTSALQQSSPASWSQG